VSNAWAAVKAQGTERPAAKGIKGKRHAPAGAFGWGSKAAKCR
jgi:hypothetical protein